MLLNGKGARPVHHREHEGHGKVGTENENSLFYCHFDNTNIFHSQERMHLTKRQAKLYWLKPPHLKHHKKR